MRKIGAFLYSYLRSMRLYYGFVTGATVLAGVMTATPREPWPGWKTAVTLAIGFLAWGVNQIFNDFFDRKADRINAPHRPMASGKLAPAPALALSGVLMLGMAAAAYFIQPWMLAVMAAGAVLNLLYSLCKPVPVLNAFLYAWAIAMCVPFGALGAGEHPDFMTEWEFLPCLLVCFVPAHFLMCSFSYYKDKTGDRAAGVRTSANLFPDRATLPVLAGLAILYSILLCLPVCMGNDDPLLRSLAILLFGGQMLLLFLLVRAIRRGAFHRATCLNCQLCVCWMFTPSLSRYPYMYAAAGASLLLIRLLFLWYRDEKE